VKDVSWNSIFDIANTSVESGNYSQKEFVSLVEKAKTVYGKKRKRRKDKSD
jgi:hypothetical protein